MSDVVPALLGWGLYTSWTFCFSGRVDSCLGLKTFVFCSSGPLRGSSDYSNDRAAVPSLRRQECCCRCHWPPLLTCCLYFRQKWTLRDWETHCKYICPSDRSEKRIDLHRAWIPAERTPVSNSCLFNPSIAGGSGGHVGERVFTFNSKTKHKKDLREERDVKFWGSGMVEYRAKGLVSLVLSISFPDENDAATAERMKQGWCWGVRFLHLCKVYKTLTHQHPTQL